VANQLKGGGGSTGPGPGERRSPAAAPGSVAAPLTPAGSAEVPCPNCGEPMLARWGASCGKCRPNLGLPKTMFMDAEGARAAVGSKLGGSLTLGWLAVVHSLDRNQRHALIELDRTTTVLSRETFAAGSDTRVVVFEDSYVSNRHATITRPLTGDRTGAFTIQDRKESPSVNGTFVNSRELEHGEVLRLADGDIIRVGVTELIFKSLWLAPPTGGA
jgi:predicted RNA-binding Zn-ribbon protein involved in translation (DUF1610 family)